MKQIITRDMAKDILGIDEGYNEKELRKKYLDRVKEIHPDLNKEDKHEEMVLLNLAYELLSKDLEENKYIKDRKKYLDKEINEIGRTFDRYAFIENIIKIGYLEIAPLMAEVYGAGDWKKWQEDNKNIFDKLDIFNWGACESGVIGNGYEEIYLITKLDNIEGYKTLSRQILNGEGNTAGCKLLKIERIDYTDEKHVVQKYEYLYNGLKSLIFVSEESVRKFIWENLDILERIRSKWFSNEPKEIGSGADGIVYDIGNSRIFKIFQNESAYKKWVEARNRILDFGNTEMKIDEIGVLGEIDNRSIYYYIMEKVEVFSDLMKEKNMEALNIFDSIILHIKNDIHMDKKWKQWKKLLQQNAGGKFENRIYKSLLKEIKNRIGEYEKYVDNDYKKNIMNTLKLSSNWYEKFVEEMILKMLTGRTDLHSGNIGIVERDKGIEGHNKERLLRYFDPAHNEGVNSMLGTRKEE